MTQNDHILKYLKNGQRINPLLALSMFGCMRLASRINDLRNAGYTILTETINKNGKRFAQYRLVE